MSRIRISTLSFIRSIEIQLMFGRWVRFSRSTRVSTIFQIRCTMYANPGWVVGTDRWHLRWTHFRRHCWHLDIVLGGVAYVTSYGRATHQAGRILFPNAPGADLRRRFYQRRLDRQRAAQ